jgi:fatty-acyl-CoA synthase
MNDLSRRAALKSCGQKVPRRVLLVEESDLTLTGSNKVKLAPLRELAARRLAGT